MKEDKVLERAQPLAPDKWDVHPSTGILTLREEALQQLINPDPIENWYILDSEPIARGQFAVVYHCHHRVTGEEYAAKFSSRWRLGSDCTRDLVHEIAVSALLRPTVRAVQLVDVFSTELELILVMEYAPGGDLQTILDENLVPYERDVINFMRQLLEGLAFIHDRNVVHLDIKPQNLVLMGEFPGCAVKLCDFEISRMLTPGHEVREILGTPDYVAPEILHYEPITTKTDMWSVGVLTYVLLTGFLPFGGDSDQETFVEILKCELDFPAELFEDITPEAIDFIKKLLIREPEKRMSAHESLNHVWIKSDMKPLDRPTTLDLSCSLSSTNKLTKTASYHPDDLANEFPQQLPLSDTLSNSSRPQNSTKDIGRPPLHPSPSQKSLISDTCSLIGTPVTTPGSLLISPFIYRQESRFGSRYNLDRLRSLSKSREVLSERVQLSNLKKSMSKSREKLGMTKSREQLMALSSFSQSVEALSALSRFTQQNKELYQSCNNIFIPKLQLPPGADNTPCRMYQSMAAIDQIDNVSYTKKGYFEPRVSLKDKDYHNDLITQRNTDMNCFIGDLRLDKCSATSNLQGIRADICRGGESCHNNTGTKHRQPEAKLTQKLPKISRSEKMKRDAQKNRNERKEKERQERLRREKEIREREKHKSQCTDCDAQKGKLPEKPAQEGASSPSFRRGSVSHVEQRIQERHERNQERLEKKQERTERKHKKLILDDPEREKQRTKTNSLGVHHRQRPRSTTPTRRRKDKKESLLGSDVSQASSLESVEVTVEKKVQDVNLLKVPELKILPCLEDADNSKSTPVIGDESQITEEADAVQEESCNDMTFICKITEATLMENNSSIETDKMAAEEKPETKLSNSDEEQGSEKLSVSEKIFAFERGLFASSQKQSPILRKQNSFTDVLSSDIKDLFIIKEESLSSTNLRPPLCQRSVSSTSDRNSIISECSNASEGKVELPQSPRTVTECCSNPSSPDWKSRARSFSVHSSLSPTPSLSKGRSRSNSFNLDSHETSAARPWGHVCNGSVARAFEKFSLKPIEKIKSKSSPLSSPSTDQVSSFN